jgi:hypothetical protein
MQTRGNAHWGGGGTDVMLYYLCILLQQWHTHKCNPFLKILGWWVPPTNDSTQTPAHARTAYNIPSDTQILLHLGSFGAAVQALPLGYMHSMHDPRNPLPCSAIQPLFDPTTSIACSYGCFLPTSWPLQPSALPC